MFCMSEHEKREQIGELAEKYSHLKGELNHLQERLNRAQVQCGILGNRSNFEAMWINNGNLYTRSQQASQVLVDGLLNAHELKQCIEEKQRMAAELNDLKQRITALAPHLL